jgi:hypothetical protein
MRGLLQQQTRSSSQLTTFLKINFGFSFNLIVLFIHMYESGLNQCLVHTIEYM